MAVVVIQSEKTRLQDKWIAGKSIFTDEYISPNADPMAQPHENGARERDRSRDLAAWTVASAAVHPGILEI